MLAQRTAARIAAASSLSGPAKRMLRTHSAAPFAAVCTPALPALQRWKPDAALLTPVRCMSTFPVTAPVAAAAVQEEVATKVQFAELEPEIVFKDAWNKLSKEVGGEENMVFPTEIIWLAGAPGAGKGTMSSYIAMLRGLTATPLETSSLFSGEMAKKAKDAGTLIGDAEVVEAVLRALLRKEYRRGVIVDGFPRTFVQAECIKHLHSAMVELHNNYLHDQVMSGIFRRPSFHITVLYVNEQESIRRQMHRGHKLEADNQVTKDLKMGKMQEARATDVSEELAAKRFRVFKEEVVRALHTIKDSFHFHLINANETPEKVMAAIKREFEYQSSLELGDDTFNMVRRISTANEIVKHARQRLVERLNSYTRTHYDLFNQVVHMLELDFVHILERQALAGTAIVRSDSALLEDKMAINMVLDVLAERGYHVTLDIQRTKIPTALGSGRDDAPRPIRTSIEKAYVFTITFKPPTIRGE